jgi:hypothetical protein
MFSKTNIISRLREMILRERERAAGQLEEDVEMNKFQEICEFSSTQNTININKHRMIHKYLFVVSIGFIQILS